MKLVIYVVQGRDFELREKQSGLFSTGLWCEAAIEVSDFFNRSVHRRPTWI